GARGRDAAAARRPALHGRTTLHRAPERAGPGHAPGRHEAPSRARRCGPRAEQTSRTPAPTHLGARAAAAPTGASIPGSNLGAVGRCARALASVRRGVGDTTQERGRVTKISRRVAIAAGVSCPHGWWQARCESALASAAALVGAASLSRAEDAPRPG